MTPWEELQRTAEIQLTEILKFFDGCRARGVLAIEVETPGGLKVKANLTPHGANELPTDQKAREELLKDPRTPEEVKARIASEDEEDLFASA